MAIQTKQEYKIGDCLKLLPEISDKSIDLILTDPPYGMRYHSGRYQNGNPHSKIINDAKFDKDFNDKWLNLSYHKLKDNGCIMVFCSYQTLQEWIESIKKYYTIKNIIIWVKNNWSAGDLTGNLGNQYEIIIFGCKGDFKLNSFRYSNVWYFKKIQPINHPTEKPVELFKRCIEVTTNKGDTVLDMFLGGGTTLRACLETNRNGIGFEIDPQYEESIKNKISINTIKIQSVNTQEV